MFDRFMAEFQPGEADAILDVGVTGDDTFESTNCFEQWYPHKHRVVGLGTEDASHLETKYPGVRVVRGDATRMPFPDASFDYVYSGAVIEHVGSYTSQRSMVRECFSIARKGVFITTPNRWFPVEVHTMIPLIHWLPKGAHRFLLRSFGMEFWAREDHLNLMSKAELEDAGQGMGTDVSVDKQKLFRVFSSNLLLIGFK